MFQIDVNVKQTNHNTNVCISYECYHCFSIKMHFVVFTEQKKNIKVTGTRFLEYFIHSMKLSSFALKKTRDDSKSG